MKKWIALLLALLLCLPAMAGAQDLTGCAIANGNVAAVESIDVVAPYSGTLESFTLEAGDRVQGGETLFSMMTTTLYAAEDGTVAAVFAAPGDDAAALMARYGGLTAVNPAVRQRISGSVLQGFNSAECRSVSVGDVMYFRSDRGDKDKGRGMVVMVSGTDFVLEVLEGEFIPTETLKLYRDDDYEGKDHVGNGTLFLREPLLSAGQGRVNRVLVEAGQQVRAGEPLLTLMTADAAPDASPVVNAPSAGVIGQVAVAPGQQVWKGQVLAKLLLTDELEVVAQVDEVDLGGLRVGDEVPVVLDMDDDKILSGRVTQISCVGVTMQNAAYYNVRVALDDDAEALIGASASVYLPREK